MTPFSIKVPESVLSDLQDRLKNIRWTYEPKDAGWHYGTNPAYLRELAAYWQTEYDWRKQEGELNQFPQYKTEIDGLSIHFILVKGKGKNPKPLILTHGWPDSVYRFYKAIPLLTSVGKSTSADAGQLKRTDAAQPTGTGADHFGRIADQSFDVIVPSLPGFGFSDKVALDSDKIAGIWMKLMTGVLGYESFYAAGGDFGSGVTKSLANQFPEYVKAIHLTDVGFPKPMEDWSKFSPAEQAFGKAVQQWTFTEGAYFMVQSTKPQTLGYGLNDSPVGLASWIIEKFNAWSDNKGDIENSFTKDELLTNIMIYWVTQTINSANRMYAEVGKALYSGTSKSEQYVETPTGVAFFPADTIPLPKEWAERKVNLQQYTTMPRGGHFAAWEEPGLWAADVTSFFGKHG